MLAKNCYGIFRLGPSARGLFLQARTFWKSKHTAHSGTLMVNLMSEAKPFGEKEVFFIFDNATEGTCTFYHRSAHCPKSDSRMD